MSFNLEQALDLIAAAADEVVCLQHLQSPNTLSGNPHPHPHPDPNSHDGLLDHMTPEHPEWQYMLAAFCLELSRKMQNIFEAADRSRPTSARDLALRILEENEAVKNAFLTAPEGERWMRMAKEADRIVHQRDPVISPRHRALLNRLAEEEAGTG